MDSKTGIKTEVQSDIDFITLDDDSDNEQTWVNLTIILIFLVIYGCRPSLPRNKHTVTTPVANVATENAEEETPLIEKPTEKQMDSVPPVKDAIQASIELIDLCDSEKFLILNGAHKCEALINWNCKNLKFALFFICFCFCVMGNKTSNWTLVFRDFYLYKNVS